MPAVAALNRWAAANSIPLISTADCHAENDPEFRTWPPHCVAGTLGQRKPDETMVGQIVLNKTTLNCFECAELPSLLSATGAERCVVYGVVTEICLRLAAFGLLKTGRRVELVTDAVKELDAVEAARVFSEFTAAGGLLTTVSAVRR